MFTDSDKYFYRTVGLLGNYWFPDIKFSQNGPTPTCCLAWISPTCFGQILFLIDGEVMLPIVINYSYNQFDKFYSKYSIIMYRSNVFQLIFIASCMFYALLLLSSLLRGIWSFALGIALYLMSKDNHFCLIGLWTVSYFLFSGIGSLPRNWCVSFNFATNVKCVPNNCIHP